MTPLPFSRVPHDQVRVATDFAVQNDLSVRIGANRVYDPKQNRNAVTSAVLTAPVPEGATLYVDVFKGFAANFQTSNWSAGVSVGGRVFQFGGGINSGSKPGSDGYIPIGNFVVPSLFEYRPKPPSTPGDIVRFLHVFRSGMVREELERVDAASGRTFVHALRDNLQAVVQAEIDEPVDFRALLQYGNVSN
jgi:hypothetical protein